MKGCEANGNFSDGPEKVDQGGFKSSIFENSQKTQLCHKTIGRIVLVDLAVNSYVRKRRNLLTAVDSWKLLSQRSLARTSICASAWNKTRPDLSDGKFFQVCTENIFDAVIDHIWMYVAAHCR